MALYGLVNIGSGTCLLPDGTMPLSEPVLTQCELEHISMASQPKLKHLFQRNVVENVVCEELVYNLLVQINIKMSQK